PAAVLQMFTVRLADCPVSVIVAVLSYFWHDPPVGFGTVRAYVYVVKAVIPLIVPSVPLNVSTTVSDPKLKPYVPEPEPFGVNEAPAFHVAVAALVPLTAEGADA